MIKDSLLVSDSQKTINPFGNNMKYIYHHLGLGDHIICNGLVRNICMLGEETYLFCKPHNIESVMFMYRDLHNLKVISGDDNFVLNYLRGVPSSDIFCVGQYVSNWYLNTMSFDQNFYYQANFNFMDRWNKFYISRDLIREKYLYDSFNKDDYVFIHEDRSRGYVINNDSQQSIRMIKGLTTNIFDYLLTIDKARQVHVIDSCLMFIIDSIPEIQKDENLFIHRYSRYNDRFNTPVLKRKWTIIN